LTFAKYFGVCFNAACFRTGRDLKKSVTRTVVPTG
jgi:hypothetical protein